MRFYKSNSPEEKQAIIREVSQINKDKKLLNSLVSHSELLPSMQNRTVDLSSLEFEQGSFIMTNSKLVLLPGHNQVTKPGYKKSLFQPLKPEYSFLLLQRLSFLSSASQLSRSRLSTKYKAKFSPLLSQAISIR